MTGKPKMRQIRGVLTSISSQRVEYKPYGYSLSFAEAPSDPIVIAFDIPEECVIEEPPDGVLVLGLDGLQAILKTTADAIDELNEQYKKQKGA